MARTLPEEVTQGTLEGDIIPGDITFYRLQSTADCKLRAYIAHGEVLPVATQSFRRRWYFCNSGDGKILPPRTARGRISHITEQLHLDISEKLYMKYFKYIGVPVEEIGYNQPKGVRYKTENPFA